MAVLQGFLVRTAMELFTARQLNAMNSGGCRGGAQGAWPPLSFGGEKKKESRQGKQNKPPFPLAHGLYPPLMKSAVTEKFFNIIMH